MQDQKEITGSKFVGMLIALVILLGLCVWAYWPTIVRAVSSGLRNSETAHALITPFAILLLMYLRRNDLIENVSKGSLWGVALLGLGLFVYAGANWPFNFGYAQDVSMVIVLAGVVLVTCGWKVLKLSVPLLLLILVSIPFGAGLYTRLIIRPETYTIGASAAVLNQLLGVDTSVKGTDLFYSLGQTTGVVGLGESYRGVRLLQPFAALGIFVAFSRIRSVLRLVFVSLCGIAILFFCNFLRLICLSLVVIYGGVGPTSSPPRAIAAVCSIFIFYALFAFLCSFRLNLFVEIEEEDASSEAGKGCHG
jgi:hypothetical protein